MGIMKLRVRLKYKSRMNSIFDSPTEEVSTFMETTPGRD